MFKILYVVFGLGKREGELSPSLRPERTPTQGRLRTIFLFPLTNAGSWPHLPSTRPCYSRRNQWTAEKKERASEGPNLRATLFWPLWEELGDLDIV